MIEVRYERGLHLPELDLWLDPRDAKPWAFVSHAHADHFARHEQALCSEVTASLIHSRYHLAESRIEAVPFLTAIERNGHRLRLLPAGHIAGSAMLHVTRVSDGATLLYTGDFKVRRGRTAETVVFQQADLLILETTFGLPKFAFPPAMEVESAVLRFVHDTLADGEVPVLLAYSLGKAQEALAILHDHGIPVLLHPTVAEMTAACRQAGVEGLPEPQVLEGPVPPGHAVITPPNTVRSKLVRSVGNRRVAMLSGWALMASSSYRYRVDEAIPLSDHADHPGLIECVQRVRPKKILTVHGYTREFAAELRQHGHDAWSATGNDQIELQLAPPPARSALPGSKTRTTASARHIRPICPLADFTSLCRLTGETNSRVEKVRHLAAYLRGLNDDDDLALATRWLTGKALPDPDARRSVRAGTLTLRSALLKLPGVREERLRELSRSQNDPATAARLLLQELALKPEALDLEGLAAFFLELAGAPGSLARIELLAERLRTLHPAEGETVVRLLAGDLRIGIKPGLVEDAIAEAFTADPAAVRHAHMISGDPGETAVLARREKLGDATARPFTPVKPMLATPMPDAVSLAAALPGPVWLETKRDGIRAQLHKQGDRAALFALDLRPLDAGFPELIAAALSIPGDFILDGEIIAHAGGRRLTAQDVDKRLGRSPVAQTDLFAVPDSDPDIPPVRFIAFDVLWHNGADRLGLPLRERRAHLESIQPLPAAISLSTITGSSADADAIQTACKQARADGHDGVIAKDPAGSYSPGRRAMAWLTLRTVGSIDCVVIAARRGSGNRAETLCEFTLAVRDDDSGQLRSIGRVKTGLGDSEIEELSGHFERHTVSTERRTHHVEPNLVLEITFDSVQPSKRNDSGLALRSPRVRAIHRDKTAADIDTLAHARSLTRD